MKKILLICSLVLASFSFWSCGECDDEDTTFDRLVGRTWVGDFGMIAPNGRFVESGLTFNANGFGQDELYYYQEDGGSPAGKFPIRWELYHNTLRVDYGNAASARELRNVYLWRGELSGDLYVLDGSTPPHRITLYME